MRHIEVARVRIGRVIWFVALALAFSWTHWLAVIASQRGRLAHNLSLNPIAIFGPLVAAVVVLVGAPTDRRRWLKSLRQWRIPPAAAAVALLLAPATFICCLAVATAITPDAPRVQVMPVGTMIAIFTGMFVTAGVGEEPGWRGFLLPELRRSVGPIFASSIVAVIWFVWHLPLFWVIGATQQHIPASSFALGILSYSLIMTWLVEVSHNSTLAAMLFHTTANVSFWLAEVYVKDLPQYHILSRGYVGTIAVFAVIAAFLLVRRSCLPHCQRHGVTPLADGARRHPPSTRCR